MTDRMTFAPPVPESPFERLRMRAVLGAGFAISALVVVGFSLSWRELSDRASYVLEAAILGGWAVWLCRMHGVAHQQRSEATFVANATP